jgi:hypothetical protein
MNFPKTGGNFEANLPNSRIFGRTTIIGTGGNFGAAKEGVVGVGSIGLHNGGICMPMKIRRQRVKRNSSRRCGF